MKKRLKVLSDLKKAEASKFKRNCILEHKDLLNIAGSITKPYLKGYKPYQTTKFGKH
jgi:hypothetical protein